MTVYGRMSIMLKCFSCVKAANVFHSSRSLIHVTQKRLYCRNNSEEDRDHKVVLTDDGRTVVCWHPKRDFPYEYSRPMPVLDQRLNEEDSVLNLQYRLDELDKYNERGPSNKQLMQLTSTNKHRWYPRGNPRKDKLRRDPNPLNDREGL